MSLQALQIGSPLHTEHSRFYTTDGRTCEDGPAASYNLDKHICWQVEGMIHQMQCRSHNKVHYCCHFQTLMTQ